MLALWVIRRPLKKKKCINLLARMVKSQPQGTSEGHLWTELTLVLLCRKSMVKRQIVCKLKISSSKEKAGTATFSRRTEKKKRTYLATS